MARTEDGEFELILGNKQLLSVFFIVVVLLGVFFTMGYIVGKNSVGDFARKTEPIMVDPSGAQREPPPSAFPEPKPVPAETGKPAPPPRVEPKPTPQPPPPETKPEGKQAKKEPPRKAEPPVSEPPAVAASGKRPVLLASGEPAAGQQFLQVVASTRPDCEIIADVLKRKGFVATVVPGPNESIFRVVVGPLADAAAVSKARADLEQAGFQKPIVRKY
ncbi:MAG: SPOR domain-containing protein [Acidobacteria bacterium]|nr:SPOR domain-containing protein [Acidobacteriota bacterium]